MKDGNGKVVRWLVGILFTILFTAFTTLTSHVIANDEKSRNRDTKISEELHSSVKVQMLQNQQILITLARIEAEIKR